MVDDIDKMLQGDDPSQASQAQLGQQDDSIQRIEQQTDEEVEWSKLSGSARERFRTAFNRARELEDELAQERATRQQFVPQAPASPDQRQALETLDQAGVATKDFAKKEITEATNKILWDLKNRDLESRYSGQNGEPQYVKEEVESYVRQHPQYNAYDPEDVFKFKMFPNEFSVAQTQTKQRTSPQLRPTKTVQRQETLTPEYIEQRLKQPDGDQWYDEHLDEINQVVSNHTLQFKDATLGGQ